MPLWIGKSAYIVATGHGIARLSEEADQVFRWSRALLRRDESPPELDVFAVFDDAGSQALVRRRGEPAALWTAGESALSPLEGLAPAAAVAVGPGAAVVAVPEGDRLVLRRAALDGRGVAVGDAVALPAAARLAGAAKLWDRPWPEDDPDARREGFDPQALARQGEGGFWPGRVRLSGNRCGVAVTSTYSGLVAVLDPTSLAPRLCFRVPAEPEQFDLFALPVPKGVLVTAVADGRQTLFVLIDGRGQVVARRDSFGKEPAWASQSPGLLWSDTRALVNQCHTGGALHWLSLSDLKSTRFSDADASDVFAIEAASTDDGARHLLALTAVGELDPKSWRLARYDGTKARAKGVEVPMPDFRPPPPPADKPGLRRAEGPPTLAVAADVAIPWRAAAGEEAALSLRVVNRGGPLRGVYVEVAGNAVTERILSAAGAGVTGAGHAEFSRRGSVLRAELPDVTLDAGLADTKPKPPPEAEPSFHLVVRIRGERAGSSLMTIRVGPLGAAGIAGSAMQGRSFVVD